MKKSKRKFVLAGLFVLAAIITGLTLTGCETEVDPSTPQQEQPDGNTGNSGGGNPQQPGGDSTGDNTGGDGNTVTVFPAEVKVLTDYTSPNHTDGSWTYVEFGEWPQTIMADGVTVDETKSKTVGMFTYYLGSDGNYYVKQGDKYYKVEPIVWRVLNKDYNSTGKALLLAEKILTGGIKWADSSNNYQNSNIRKWLNGNNGTAVASDYTGGSGFLQTAFTTSAQDRIASTIVDNSAASTNPASNPQQWNSGNNPYASDTPTTDKIFLLSEKEATTDTYGFAEYNQYGTGSTRIRVTTDYAKATGAYQSPTEGYGGWWWLRSSDFNVEYFARYIDYDGNADNIGYVDITSGGVVPALSISLGGN